MEAYSASGRAAADLVDMAQLCFELEDVPDDMPVGEFIFIWKNKRGKSRDDMSQYRTANRLAPPSPRHQAVSCLGLPRGLGKARQPKGPA